MKNKKVNKKLLALFSTLVLALTMVSASFFNYEYIKASNYSNEDVQQLFINKYNDTYFENNFNYSSKLSNTTIELFNSDMEYINFGIEYYTYENYENNGTYKYYSNNILSGVMQASNSSPKVVYYNNVNSYYMKVNFKNVVIPCLENSTTDFQFLNAELFANTLNNYLSDIYLYCGDTNVIPTYNIEYTLLLYDKANGFNVNYNNSVRNISATYIAANNMFYDLGKIFTYNVLYDSFNTIDTTTYNVQMPYEDFYQVCSSTYILSNYNYYYIIPNLSISIDTVNEIPTTFYCVNNIYNNVGAHCVYDNEFLSYLNTFAVSNQLPTNYFNVYYSGYLNGFNNGQRDAKNFKNGFEDLIWSIIDAPMQTINNGFNFEIFGINFANVIKVVLSVLIVGFCVKLLL